ncbi:LmeA family phospholipid-binding protein [Streptomyces sp. Lzd4kr]|nr:LmeA family phospholipid-binding protein [Streptomyces sp. Lzd4kr]
MHRTQHGHDGHAYDEHADDCEPSREEPGEPYLPGTRPRSRPRRRTLTLTAAVLVALALLPVAVDRVVAARIESRTAKAFQQGMGTPEAPEVEVRGFPVVTQAASGTLRHVDITAHDIPARGSARPLPVSELSLSLDGLTKADDDSEARARITGLIDHERAFWGDPAAELASLAYGGPTGPDSDLVAGYTEAGGTLDFTPRAAAPPGPVPPVSGPAAGRGVRPTRLRLRPSRVLPPHARRQPCRGAGAGVTPKPSGGAAGARVPGWRRGIVEGVRAGDVGGAGAGASSGVQASG